MQPSVVTLMHHDVRDLSLELEFVGPDLSQFTDEGRMSLLSEDIALQIWMDISAGLADIHARQVAHFDIKPENILLSNDGRAKLCDFGISVLHATTSIPPDGIHFSGGTPRYTPPEFVRFDKRGCPADIWGFGLVMMFVLRIVPLPEQGGWRIAHIRSKASAATKMLQWFEKIEQAKARIPEKYSLLHKMLKTDPGRRISPSELETSLSLIKTQHNSLRRSGQASKRFA